MKTWLRTLVWLFEGLIVLGAVYFEPTCCVRGVLWNEAFFDDRPTSYWRGELHQWKLHELFLVSTTVPADATFPPGLSLVAHKEMPVYGFSRTPPLIERFRARWLHSIVLAERLDEWPRLLQGDAAAEPVLRELLDDPSEHIRNMARFGLSMELDFSQTVVR